MLKFSKYILGMNSRNLEFIRPWNRQPAWHIADNKLLAKRVLRKAGIPVPKTYAIITSPWQLRNFDISRIPKSFVLKPNRGLGGEGILITYNRKPTGSWLDSDLKEIYFTDIKEHAQEILDGRFSLADMPDVAFFEERLVKESMFKPISYRGVPDFRIIVFNHVPIMAEMRLPTKESHGRANLHLGGIGVGIDIAEGITTYAICRDRLIQDKKFSGIKIPEWDNILSLAIKVQQVVNLGFIGVDIVLAKNKGPVVLELNARPGLSIQNANMAGLKDRLTRIRGLEVDSVERGLSLAKHLFGTSDVFRVASLKTTLHIVEPVVLYHKQDKDCSVTIKAKIDSGAESSSVDYELGRKIGYGDVIDYLKKFPLYKPMKRDEAKRLERKLKRELKSHPEISSVKIISSASGSTVRVTVPVSFKLKGNLVRSDINLISREHLKYDMIVGRRDLEGFLIKPGR